MVKKPRMLIMRWKRENRRIRNMLNEDIDISIILKVTDLTEEQIEDLK